MNPQDLSHPSSGTPQPQLVRDYTPRGFRWVKAAAILAAGESVEKAAAAAGVKPNAIRRWKRQPKFASILARYQKDIEQEIKNSGIALKTNRIRKINAHFNRIERVIEARAEAMALDHDAIGGDSGLIAHTQKVIGGGFNAQVVDEYQFDAGLDRAYRETLKLIAQEVGGQFDEAPSPTGPAGTGPKVTIVFPVLSLEDQQKIENAVTIDLPPTTRRLVQRPSDGKPL